MTPANPTILARLWQTRGTRLCLISLAIYTLAALWGEVTYRRARWRDEVPPYNRVHEAWRYQPPAIMRLLAPAVGGGEEGSGGDLSSSSSSSTGPGFRVQAPDTEVRRNENAEGEGGTANSRECARMEEEFHRETRERARKEGGASIGARHAVCPRSANGREWPRMEGLGDVGRAVPVTPQRGVTGEPHTGNRERRQARSHGRDERLLVHQQGSSASSWHSYSKGRATPPPASRSDGAWSQGAPSRTPDALHEVSPAGVPPSGGSHLGASAPSACPALPGTPYSTRLLLRFRQSFRQSSRQSGVSHSLQPPLFLLGSDNLGRDVLLRLVQGTRIAFLVGVLTSLIALPLGVLLGCLGGYFGGRMDAFVVWLCATVASMPSLLLILAVSMVVGKGLAGVTWGIGLTTWVGVCRSIRAEVIKHRGRTYVEAARVLGYGHGRILLRHILPNVMHLVLISFSVRFPAAVGTEVFVSFLGIGVQGEPSWGVMLNNARLRLWQGVWWEMTFVTLALFGLVLTFNVLADRLRDLLDPATAQQGGGKKNIF